MFDQPAGHDQPAEVDRWTLPEQADSAEAGPVTRPGRWAVSNWPVHWKVLAIALVPMLMAAVLGGLRIHASVVAARDLNAAAARAELLPAIDDYLAATEDALATQAAGGDAAHAMAAYEEKRSALQWRFDSAVPVSDVRLAVTTLLDSGRQLLDGAVAGQLDLRQQVTTYSPLLLTAESAITGSVRLDDERLRAQAEGMSRAVGSRGQMAMQRMLIERGGDIPEPELRSSMIALAGAEPHAVMGMTKLLGEASEDASALRTQMVQRRSVMSDLNQPLVDNVDLLASIQDTDRIAQKLISDATASITTTVGDKAAHQRSNAIRDAVIVLVGFLVVLAIVAWVARSLVRPLRQLRDGALRIAHQDLAHEIDQVKAGDEREPAPLPIRTTEEIGQVAHAVDELHAQALLLAGDEARLRLMVNDMFETMSRRNKSLVDSQLSLIDQLERNEENPQRLDSLFELDHLATRMRRNSANLLVLAGAQTWRERDKPVPLATLVNAAASEVEEYRRVEVGAVSESSVVGSVATDSIHLLAELIDNALRYSPPTEPVHVRAVDTSGGGVLVEVQDAGLGMTDGDLRIANMRLTSGGEVTPDNARHMGLFVVGRLAAQHDMTVRLLDGADGLGTTAQLYLPPELVDGGAPGIGESVETAADVQQQLGDTAGHDTSTVDESAISEAAESVSAAVAVDMATVAPLPVRDPGSSGIGDVSVTTFDVPTAPTGQRSAEQCDEPARGRESAQTPSLPADTSAFFASRADYAPNDSTIVIRYEGDPEADAVQYVSTQPRAADEAMRETGSGDLTDVSPPADETSSPVSDSGVDLIYQSLLSEWLIDPHELAVPLDWKSVWDNGWAAAAAAEDKPVLAHTDHGLPVREPGARLVPGAATDPRNHTGADDADGEGPVASDGGRQPDDEAGGNAAVDRDPDAIRASIGNHFKGVRAARSPAPDTTEGPDDQ
jgi:signal transduction histidine kinase